MIQCLKLNFLTLLRAPPPSNQSVFVGAVQPKNQLLALKFNNIQRKRIACVGDGGNDVAMIQVANVGIGIVGKEGM